MSAEWVAVIAACTSAVISIIAIVVTIVLHNRETTSRGTWESKQVEDRRAWELILQNRQQDWQKQQDDAHRAWQDDQTVPKLRVETTYGIFPHLPKETYVYSRAQNVGAVPVYVSNWGQIVLPNGQIMEMPEGNTDRYGLRDDPTTPIDPGNVFTAYWNVSYLQDQLKKHGYDLGNFIFKTRWQSRIGGDFVSDEIPMIRPDQNTN